MEGDEINREVKEAESPTCNKVAVCLRDETETFFSHNRERQIKLAISDSMTPYTEDNVAISYVQQVA